MTDTVTKPRRGRPPRNKPQGDNGPTEPTTQIVGPADFPTITVSGTATLPQGALDASAYAPAREPVRQPLRAEDSREAARLRAAEIMGQVQDVAEGPDEFYFDIRLIPDGWTYEWKRHTVQNAPDPAYEVQLTRTGWEPVPATRHPFMMPSGYTGNTIERKGMILMQRPKEITDHFRARDNKNARDQVRFKEQQVSAAPAGQFDRTPATVKTGDYRPVDIPKDAAA
jgi:hypothetical protein